MKLNVELYYGWYEGDLKVWETETIELEFSEEEYRKLPDYHEDYPDAFTKHITELAVNQSEFIHQDDIALWGMYNWEWEEDDGEDFDDDPSEANYNPYMGQDEPADWSYDADSYSPEGDDN